MAGTIVVVSSAALFVASGSPVAAETETDVVAAPVVSAVAVTVIATEDPAAMSPSVQVTTPPLSVHDPWSGVALWYPSSAGRVIVATAAVASAGPELTTVTVYDVVEPTTTGSGESATVSERSADGGDPTHVVTDAGASSEVSRVVSICAVPTCATALLVYAPGVPGRSTSYTSAAVPPAGTAHGPTKVSVPPASNGSGTPLPSYDEVPDRYVAPAGSTSTTSARATASVPAFWSVIVYSTVPPVAGRVPGSAALEMVILLSAGRMGWSPAKPDVSVCLVCVPLLM